MSMLTPNIDISIWYQKRRPQVASVWGADQSTANQHTSYQSGNGQAWNWHVLAPQRRETRDTYEHVRHPGTRSNRSITIYKQGSSQADHRLAIVLFRTVVFTHPMLRRAESYDTSDDGWTQCKQTYHNADNAVVGERSRRIGKQACRMQQAVNHLRLEDIQLKMAVWATDGDGDMVAHNLSTYLRTPMLLPTILYLDSFISFFVGFKSAEDCC